MYSWLPPRAKPNRLNNSAISRTNCKDAQAIKVNAESDDFVQDASDIGHIVDSLELGPPAACTGVEGAPLKCNRVN